MRVGFWQREQLTVVLEALLFVVLEVRLPAVVMDFVSDALEPAASHWTRDLLHSAVRFVWSS